MKVNENEMKEKVINYFYALEKEGLISAPEKDFESWAIYYFLKGFKAYGDIQREVKRMKEDDKKKDELEK